MVVLSTTVMDLPQNLTYWLISNSLLLSKPDVGVGGIDKYHTTVFKIKILRYN